MILHAQLVQGLQTAIGATLGGVIHMVSPQAQAEVWGARTLVQIANAARDVDLILHEDLQKAALRVQTSRNPEAARNAWLKFTEIVAGHSVPDTGRQRRGLLERLNAVVMRDSAKRGEWLSEGLGAMGVTELMRSPIIERVKGMKEIRLTVSRGSDAYFRSRILERQDAVILEITAPRNLMIITEEQIKLMSARALLFDSAGMDGVMKRLAPFTHVTASRLSKPICPIIEAFLVERLCRALQTNDRLKDFAGIVPQDRGIAAAFNPEVLDALAQKIGEVGPNAGARLLAFAAKVRAADNNGDRYRAWEKYVDTLEGIKNDAFLAGPLIGMDVAADAVKILAGTDPSRWRAWLSEGLRQLGVPAADAVKILSGADPLPWQAKFRGRPGQLGAPDTPSIIINLDSKRGIYPFFEASVDDKFGVRLAINSTAIDATISVPATGRSLSLHDIQLLVSRAILMTYARDFILPADRKRYSRMDEEAIGSTVPIMTLSIDGKATRLGNVGFTGTQIDSFSSIMRWLSAGSAITAPRQSRDPVSAGNSVSIKPPAGTDADRWRALRNAPNAEKIFFEHLKPVLRMVRNFVFRVSDETDGRLRIESKTKGQRETVHVTVPEGYLPDITGFDLIDIMLRVAYRDDVGKYHKEETARKKGYRAGSRHPDATSSDDPLAITLAELKNGTDLAPTVKTARSLFELALAFRFFDAAAHGTVDVTGSVATDAKQNLAYALTAISRAVQMMPQLRAGWEDILKIRRWHLQKSGVRMSSGLIVDAIPAGDTAIVHIHGDNGKIPATYWLYLLSVIAAHPSFAVRAHPENREVLSRGHGNPMPLYSSIAANRIFEPFGVFDPTASMPDSISFSMPGGVAAEKNPHYNKATAKKKEDYVRSLRWFAITPMPDEWRPLATDTYEALKKKYRNMTKAWHPDTNPDPEETALFGVATGHWENIFNIYP